MGISACISKLCAHRLEAEIQGPTADLLLAWLVLAWMQVSQWTVLWKEIPLQRQTAYQTRPGKSFQSNIDKSLKAENIEYWQEDWQSHIAWGWCLSQHLTGQSWSVQQLYAYVLAHAGWESYDAWLSLESEALTKKMRPHIEGLIVNREEAAQRLSKCVVHSVVLFNVPALATPLHDIQALRCTQQASWQISDVEAMWQQLGHSCVAGRQYWRILIQFQDPVPNLTPVYDRSLQDLTLSIMSVPNWQRTIHFSPIHYVETLSLIMHRRMEVAQPWTSFLSRKRFHLHYLQDKINLSDKVQRNSGHVGIDS